MKRPNKSKANKFTYSKSEKEYKEILNKFNDIHYPMKNLPLAVIEIKRSGSLK